MKEISISTKEQHLEQLFASCHTPEQIYEKIIELGKTLPPFDPSCRLEKNLVSGCQSTMYLHTSFQEGVLFFSVDSDALISKGLAALLLFVYNEEKPEAILKNPPHFLVKLQLKKFLSLGRSNGLASLFLKMQQEALSFLSSPASLKE